MNRQADSETGLPPGERAFLGAALRLSSVLVGSRSQLRTFATEANRILQILEQVDYDFASQRARIPRLQGIEPASCHWSLFMVLDHLVRVDQQILTVIQALRQGYVPQREIAIAEFKPDPDSGAETIDQFQMTARKFQSTVHDLMPLRTVARFSHPWFGPLDARDWTALAAAHHRIHRRQARKIVTVLGIT